MCVLKHVPDKTRVETVSEFEFNSPTPRSGPTSYETLCDPGPSFSQLNLELSNWRENNPTFVHQTHCNYQHCIDVILSSLGLCVWLHLNALADVTGTLRLVKYRLLYICGSLEQVQFTKKMRYAADDIFLYCDHTCVPWEDSWYTIERAIKNQLIRFHPMNVSLNWWTRKVEEKLNSWLHMGFMLFCVIVAYIMYTHSESMGTRHTQFLRYFIVSSLFASSAPVVAICAQNLISLCIQLFAAFLKLRIVSYRMDHAMSRIFVYTHLLFMANLLSASMYVDISWLYRMIVAAWYIYVIIF